MAPAPSLSEELAWFLPHYAGASANASQAMEFAPTEAGTRAAAEPAAVAQRDAALSSLAQDISAPPAATEEPRQSLSSRSTPETIIISTEIDPDCITVSRCSVTTPTLSRLPISEQANVFTGARSLYPQVPASVTEMPSGRPPNAATPDPDRQSRIVTLHVDLNRFSVSPQSQHGGASPEGITLINMIPTPPDSQTESGEELRAITPKSAKKRKQHTDFSPGLYGRTPNPRRAATKAHRGPVTPIKKPKAAQTQQLPPEEARNKATQARHASEPVATPRKRQNNDDRSNLQEKRQRTENDRLNRRNVRAATVAMGQTISAPQSPRCTSRSDNSTQDPAPTTQPLSVISRPLRDPEGDQRFVNAILPVLERRGAAKRRDMGKRQNQRISSLLRQAGYPTGDDALFLSGEEAAEWLRPGKFWNSIIITEGQQALPLQTPEDFLGECYDDNAQVWVQDPKVMTGPTSQIVKQVKIGLVKERLLVANQPTDKPWNLLELATHCDDGLRPAFLNTEDSRLLTKLKIPGAADHTRRKVYEQGYKEVEKWALLAEAGALTEPHQDSHGYSTYITINQGLVGFGWLCKPTAEERKQWQHAPGTFEGGRWRYVILKPGQTVYFPAGTVHFVFRHPDHGHTLAFGGHILRCSNIVHWVNTLLEERDQKEITNEDLTDSATGYLARVEKFVHHAIKTGTEDKWGGSQAIEEFLELKKEFARKRQSRK